MKILLIENDRWISRWLRKALTKHHYVVDIVSDSRDAWGSIEAFDYDLLIVNVVSPLLDGINLVRKVRICGCEIPILLLTEDSHIEKGIDGLDAGADDYVIKPYNIDEILARIRALLRRGKSSIAPVMKWGILCLDPNSCEATYGDRPLKLTPKEYRLLELFVRNGSRVLSSCVIRDNLWSLEEYPQQDAVKSHVKRLRQKLAKAGALKDFIETVYGLGYRLNKRWQNQNVSHSVSA